MSKEPDDGQTHIDFDADWFRTLAFTEPNRALAVADRILAGKPDPQTSAVVHQVVGLALRDTGHLSAALGEFRLALRLAKKAQLSDLQADIGATYGGSLMYAGRTREGLSYLDQAVIASRGMIQARARHRRAYSLYLQGQHSASLADLKVALAAARRQRDLTWVAHMLNVRCMVNLALGAVDQADLDAESARRLYRDLDQRVGEAMSIQNRGAAAVRRGDLPTALRLLDQAIGLYKQADEDPPDVTIDLAEAYMVAGLAREATATSTGYLAAHDAIQPIKRAELLHMAAAASLAAGDAQAALGQARAARRMFAAQERPYWEARAEYVSLQARHAAGRRDKKLLAEAIELARRLGAARSDDAPGAYLFAGRLAMQRRDHELAEVLLAEVARHRSRGPALARTTAWLAVALQADDAGESHRVLAACQRGLDALDEHRLAFGGTELRALATGYGAELAALGLRHTLGSGRPRQLLIWSERWRATALVAPAVRPPDDAELGRDLAALRDATRRVEQARASGQAHHRAEKERAQWENAVRQRRLQVSGRGGSAPRFDLDALFENLGSSQAVVLVSVDGTLHALVVGNKRVRRYEVGSMDEAVKESDFARFALRGAAYGRRVGDLASTGARLQTTLFGPAARSLGEGPVIVVPPARLHGVPWGLLPTLARSQFTVSPSLSMWAKARATPEPSGRRTALILGPGLTGAESEVASLARLHPQSSVLAGPDASSDKALDLLNGAWLAHIAAHGSFRSDSPLFSNLTLHDGPLTVHDIDRLGQPPYRMILSACEVGGGEAVGADELLGLVSSLLALGTAGVLASVVPVHDQAAVGTMVEVHSMLARGYDLPQAWLAARVAASGDPLATATAASFTSWGV